MTDEASRAERARQRGLVRRARRRVPAALVQADMADLQLRPGGYLPAITGAMRWTGIEQLQGTDIF